MLGEKCGNKANCKGPEGNVSINGASVCSEPLEYDNDILSFYISITK
jgi:hypothetical protein